MEAYRGSGSIAPPSNFIQNLTERIWFKIGSNCGLFLKGGEFIDQLSHYQPLK
jgi:hypothetical protein